MESGRRNSGIEENLSGNVVDSIREADYKVEARKWKRYANTNKVGALFNRLIIATMREQPTNVPKFIEQSIIVDDKLKETSAAYANEFYDKCVALYEESISAIEEVFGNNPDKLVKVYSQFGSAHEMLGNYRDAIARYQQALEICEEGHVSDSTTVISLLNQMAALEIISHNFDGAMKMLERALPAMRNIEGQDTENVGDVKANLAVAYKEMGNMGQAMTYYREAIEIYSTVCGPCEKAADALNSLAQLESEGGNTQEALMVLEETLTIRQSILPSGHKSIVDTINSMAILQYKHNCHEQAHELCGEIMEIMESAGGGTLDTQFREKADKEFQAGNYDESFALYQRAISTYQKSLGKMTQMLTFKSSYKLGNV